MKTSYVPVSDRSVWRADTIRPDDCFTQLSPAEVAELKASITALGERAATWRDLDATDFRFDLMTARLASIREDLEARGFVILRGMPVDGQTIDALKALYWGLGLHLGDLVPQNQFDELLTEVANPPNPLKNRGYTGNHALNPHCDPVDIISLFSVRKAKTGGRSTIVSAAAVYNEMIEHRPDYVEILRRGFYFERKNGGSREHPMERLPVFWENQGRFSCRFNANWIRDGADIAGVELTEGERAAVACFVETAGRPEVRVEVTLEPGDLLLLNNRLALHARSAFEDWEQPDRKRLLLRLWINAFKRTGEYTLSDRYGNGRPAAAYIY